MNFDDLSVIRGRLDDLRETLAAAKPELGDMALHEALRRNADEMYEWVITEIRYRGRSGNDS